MVRTGAVVCIDVVVRLELQVEDATDVEMGDGMEAVVYTGIEVDKDDVTAAMVDTEDGLVTETGEDTEGDTCLGTTVDTDVAAAETEDTEEFSGVQTDFTEAEFDTVREETVV